VSIPADPPVNESAPELPTVSVGGLLFGGDTLSRAIAGATLEGGVHLRGTVWVHGEVIAGAPLYFDQHEDGSYFAGRRGVERSAAFRYTDRDLSHADV